jgi:hypothetical protein
MSACLRKPSLTALLTGLIPCVAICFAVPLWDRIDPMVIGLPFNLFWLTLWTLLTPLFLWIAHLAESAAESRRLKTEGERRTQ